MTYDGLGRVERTTTLNNNAYTRYYYGENYVQSWSTINSAADEGYRIQYFDGAGRAIQQASLHPGSAGGYRAAFTVYDVMGRVWQQSQPVEINGGWQVAGDDHPANSGYGLLYRTQTYDWKGRPLVSTNVDGTSVETSYGGCGCAGGAVVTITGEQLAEGRRRQRVYADGLGRTVRTELLNWDQSVYATTVQEYDGRDQVTKVKQYQGAATADGSCPTGTCQQAETQYDGFGRVWRQHTPLMDANAWTTATYRKDGVVAVATDARGATATYGYNQRHLVTNISYTTPNAATIPLTPTVSYAYDGAGNRTQMTDGAGNTHTYAYDQLSRLTAEVNIFSGFGTFTLGYQYNLADQVTQLALPMWSQTVSYSHDAAGQLTTVAGTGFPNVSQFVTNRQYRATGAPKSIAYGDTLTENFSYNARWQLTSYTLRNAAQQNRQASLSQYGRRQRFAGKWAICSRVFIHGRL